MRKYLAIILAVAFVLGLGASAYADQAVASGDTKITLGGEIRVRGEYRSNTISWMDNGSKHQSNYDQRLRLSLKADIGKNTTGFIHLMNGGVGNDVVNQGAATIGGGGGTGIFQTGNEQQGGLTVYEAWILHKFDSAPVGIKVGHMPLKLGRGLFYDHTKQGDDAIVLFADPTKELHVGIVQIKFDEGIATGFNNGGTAVATTNSSSDADATALVVTYKLDKATSFGLNATYVKDRNFYGLTGGVSNAWGNSINHATADVYNVGFNADTTIAGLGLYLDVEKQFGTLKKADNGSTTGTYSPRDLKLSGLAVMAGASYKIDPVTLTLEYAYGSGDNYNQDSNSDGIRDDNKFKGFITALGTDKHSTYVYEYRTRSAANAGLNVQNTINNVGGKFENAGLSSASTGLNNTQYIKAAVDATPVKDLSVNLSYFWLKASKSTSMSSILGAHLAPRINLTNGVTTINNHRLSKDIGNEVDFNVTYNLNKNLKYWVEGGYLFVGGAWDYFDTKTNTNKNGEDIFCVRNGIQLNF